MKIHLFNLAILGIVFTTFISIDINAQSYKIADSIAHVFLNNKIPDSIERANGTYHFELIDHTVSNNDSAFIYRFGWNKIDSGKVYLLIKNSGWHRWNPWEFFGANDLDIDMPKLERSLHGYSLLTKVICYESLIYNCSVRNKKTTECPIRIKPIPKESKDHIELK